MRTFIFLSFLAFTPGCTTIPMPLSDADPVPATRIYSHSAKSDGVLAVLLPREQIESDCAINLAIDDEHAADFAPGEFAYFGVTIGTHKLSTEPIGNCDGFKSSKTDIHVKAGDASLWRIIQTEIEAIIIPSR